MEDDIARSTIDAIEEVSEFEGGECKMIRLILELPCFTRDEFLFHSMIVEHAREKGGQES